MPSIERALGRHRSPILYVGATAFVAGLLLVAAGTLSVVRTAFDPITAAPATWGAVVTGVFLATLLFVVIAVLDDDRTRPSAIAGVGVAYAGAAIFGVTAGLWAPVAVPAIAAAVVYAAGIAGLVVAFFSVAIERRFEIPSVFTPSTATDAGVHRNPGTISADGGDDDDELEFLLDDDDEKGK